MMDLLRRGLLKQFSIVVGFVFAIYEINNIGNKILQIQSKLKQIDQITYIIKN